MMPATVADPLRVLIVSEHASLKFGGEASLPYYYFKLFRKRGAEVWMIVHERTRAELAASFPEDIDRITFIPDTALHKLLWRVQSKLPRKLGEQTLGVLHHLYTQLLARRAVKQTIAQQRIDVVHEPMPISPKETSMMFGLGVPVVIGPMCGGMDYPPAFQYLQSGLSRWIERIGRWVSHSVHHLIRGKLTADVLVVAHETTARALPRGHRGRVLTVCESGADLSIWTPNDTPAELREEVRFTFLGRLVDWKGVDLLLEAFKSVADASAKAVLRIAGDGPLRSQLEARAAELGIAGRVNFLGHLTRQGGAELVRSSDVLVLPSLRECGGTVLLEAMAVGVPMVATDWGGPGHYIDDTCGIRVSPDTRDGFIAGLAAGMIKLANSPELRRQMSEGGQRRVRELYFDWDSKADRLLDILKDAVHARRTTAQLVAAPIASAVPAAGH